MHTSHYFLDCTLRRRSPSEKLTPSRDTDFPFLPFVEAEVVNLFGSSAEMYKRQQVSVRKVTKKFVINVVKLPKVRTDWLSMVVKKTKAYSTTHKLLHTVN